LILVVAATETELAASGAADALCCGIGPAESGIRTARALAELQPDAVLHVGIAGAPELEPLSVVIGTEALYADIVDPASTVPRVERVDPSRELVEAAQRALPDAHLLPITSCARVGGGGECQVEAMEGFSVLRAAELAGVPAVEVRTISNRPADSDRSLWRIEDALARLGEIVPPLVDELASAVRR
jgi:nucleoside phosphorylase